MSFVSSTTFFLTNVLGRVGVELVLRLPLFFVAVLVLVVIMDVLQVVEVDVVDVVATTTVVRLCFCCTAVMKICWCSKTKIQWEALLLRGEVDSGRRLRRTSFLHVELANLVF